MDTAPAGRVGKGRETASMKQDVTPLLIADLEARAAVGLKKYGRPLQTHNGRNALLDAYEEALDMALYLKQALMEQEETDGAETS